jgi:hypothetical protein
MKPRFLLLLLGALLANGPLSGQYSDTPFYENGPLRYSDHVYQQGLRSVRLSPLGANRGFPVIALNSGERLLFSFDDLYEDYVEYSYTVIHCNADWQPSDLMSSQYLANLTNDYITDYSYSINALIPYTHYRLTLPNDKIKFTKSGNYLLLVYRDGNQSQPVITRRFMVYEELVSVGATVKRPNAVSLMNTHQEIDFTVNHPNYNIQNPYQDLQVHVLQNQRYDNALTDLKPRFVQQGALVYQYDEENTFAGGNEFRFFDIKNLQSLSQNVRNIERTDKFEVYLAKGRPRTSTAYSTWPDIDGQYRVRRLDAGNSETTADYALVNFYLSRPEGPLPRPVYVFGELSTWKLRPEFRMQYDQKAGAYRLQAYLKQGYYNYMYAQLPDKPARGVDLESLEGSHWETQNTYQILVYNRELGARYDRLVGFGAFNSQDLF